MGEIEWIVLTEDEKRLYSRLTAHRRSIANGCGVDDEEVLTNAELVWLVHHLPTTLEAVRTIPGMCAKRADKWSASFLPILSGRAPRRREHSEPPKGALSKEQRELLRRLKALHKAEWDGIHANGPGEWAGGPAGIPFTYLELGRIVRAMPADMAALRAVQKVDRERIKRWGPLFLAELHGMPRQDLSTPPLDDEALLLRLMNVRNDIAIRMRGTPRSMLTDDELRIVAQSRPLAMPELLALPGVDNRNAGAWGAEFLQVMARSVARAEAEQALRRLGLDAEPTAANESGEATTQEEPRRQIDALLSFTRAADARSGAMRIGDCFYHLTHQRNIAGILRHGILSWDEASRRGLRLEDISDPAVQVLRSRLEPVYGRCLHDYVPLYLNPRNPMLYVRREMQNELVILCVSPSVIVGHGYVFTDGNAASAATEFSADASVVESSLDALRAQFWNDYPDGKRRRCAEVLVHPRVETEFIVRAVCENRTREQELRAMCPIPVVIDAAVFF